MENKEPKQNTNDPSKPLQFEDVLKKVGNFGRHQKTLVLAFLIPAMIVMPWFSLNPIFSASTPDHWCRVPEIMNSNLSLEMQQMLTRPKDNPSCSMYDINYTDILMLGVFNVNATWTTKPCDQGWVYDTTYYDANAVTRWNLVCDDRHYSKLIMTLMFSGDVLGSVIFGHLADKFGRKPIFFILAFCTSISEISSVLIPNFTGYLILRAINGSTMSCMYLLTYIIPLEIVGPDRRTLMNGVAATSWTIGLCLLPLAAWLTHGWISLSAVISSCAMALLLYWWILPESPSWLVSQGKYNVASNIMANIDKTNNKKSSATTDKLLADLRMMGECMKKERMQKEKYSYLDFFRHTQLRKRFLLITICWCANSMVYFGLQMNVENLFGNTFLNFFIMSLVEIPSHVVTCVFMEKIGRRWCSVGAFIFAGIVCLLPVTFPQEKVVGVVASILGKIGSSSAFVTLYQQSPELFPTPLRSMGMSLGATIATTTTLTAPYIVYLATYAKFIPFTVFSMLTFAAALSASFLPETLNKKLPQTIEDAEYFGTGEKFFSFNRKHRLSSSVGTCNAIKVDTLPLDNNKVVFDYDNKGFLFEEIRRSSTSMKTITK